MTLIPHDLSKEITKEKVVNCCKASTTQGNLLNAYLNVVVLLRREQISKVMKMVLDDVATDYRPEYFFEPSIVEQLNLEEIAVIVKRVITTRYRLLFSKPFRQDFSITADQFWDIASDWLRGEGGAVVWGVDERWLIIHTMNNQQAFFVGGEGSNIIKRDEFCSSVNHSPYHYLQSVRFVKRLEDVYE